MDINFGLLAYVLVKAPNEKFRKSELTIDLLNGKLTNE